ncbi:MAG: hypothetical protein J6Y02_23890 [Pseudobutyrivibrio sp.]|nr:hypothetical protein [Pseudobutyrivibrio sp.]
MGLSNSLMTFGKLLVKHSPKILTVASGVCTVATGVLSFRSGVKSSKIIEDMRKDIQVHPENKKKIILDGTKKMAPHVIPPIITCVTGIACAGKAQSINTKRLLDISSVAAMSVAQLGDLNRELKEEDKIKLANKAVEKRLNMTPETQHYILDAGGDVYCSIPYLNVDFVSDYETVNQAIENLAFKCANSGGVTGTDLLELLGIYDYVGPSDIFYWTTANLDSSSGIPVLPIETTTVMRYNKPCLAIYFRDYNVKKY